MAGTLTRQRRRGLDWTVIAQLAAMVPSLLTGLVIILAAASLVIGYIPQAPAWTDWIPLTAASAWFLMGFLWFAHFTQSFLARFSFHVRLPIAAERVQLEHSWHEVLHRAGIKDRSRYGLWVKDDQGLNAFAAGGNIVTVTRGALRYHGVHLGAVLAHELGHHLNGHTYVGILAWWYGLPLYWLKRVVRFLFRLALGIVRFVSYFNGLVALVCYLFVASAYLSILMMIGSAIYWAWQTSWVAVVLLALAVAMSPVMGRQGEYRADKTAVQLGYGPALVEVFREWQSLGFDDGARRGGLRALYMASHPPLHARIRKIEQRLARTP